MNPGLKSILYFKLLAIYLNHWIIILICIFSFSIRLIGETSPVNVSAKIDTNQIRIGEQFHLKLSSITSPGKKVAFPFLPDTFNHFELVNKSGIDTFVSKDKKELTLQQQVTLTSFDSGYFVLPPFSFIIRNENNTTDTISTETQLISVRSVLVDTTKEIKSLKGIIEVPFPWQDYILYLLATLAIAAIGIYLYRRFRKKEGIPFLRKIPERPAHEIALEGLKRIESEKLWQQGFTKKYYSELSDILRQYIERRFSFNAMEQTTDEILRHFDRSNIQDNEKENLSDILSLADMVKFAKALSLPTENERSMQMSYDFINNTRPVVKEDFEKEEAVK